MIEEYAFYECKNLKEVVFEEGSRLEEIVQNCFCSAGIERIVIPRGIEKIQRGVFLRCRNLKEVVFEEGSKLKTIQE